MTNVLEEFLAQLNNLEDGDWYIDLHQCGYNMNDYLKEDE